MHDALITLFFCHIPKEQRKTTTRITKQKQQEIYNKSQHYNLQSNALSRERLREIALCPVCDHLRQTQSRPAAYMSKLSKQCTMYICVYVYVLIQTNVKIKTVQAAYICVVCIPTNVYVKTVHGVCRRVYVQTYMLKQPQFLWETFLSPAPDLLDTPSTTDRGV